MPSWALALLASLAAAVRLPGLGRSLWYDELFTLERFASGLGAALGTQVAANNHPLASLLAWPATAAGAGEAWLRLPFALLGAAAAPALGWGVARALGARAGWLAGALLAVAPSHVLLSQQARGYAPMTAAAALATGLLLVHLARGGSRATGAALAACVALGMWGHLTLAAAVAAWGGALAVAGWRRWAPTGELRAPALALGAGLGGGLLLWAPILGRTLKFVGRNLDVPPAAGLHPGPLTISGGVALLGGGSLTLGLVLCGAAAAGAAALARRAPTRAAAAALAAPGLAVLALTALGALGYARFLAFALPSTLALAACGVAAVGRRGASPWRRVAPGLLAAALVAPAAWLVQQDRRHELQDLRGAARRAQGWSHALGGAPIVALGPGAELLARYAPGARVDVAGASLPGARGPAVFLVPLPAWLEGTPAARDLLFRDAAAIRTLPGRESAVLLVVRPDTPRPTPERGPGAR